MLCLKPQDKPDVSVVENAKDVIGLIEVLDAKHTVTQEDILQLHTSLAISYREVSDAASGDGGVEMGEEKDERGRSIASGGVTGE